MGWLLVGWPAMIVSIHSKNQERERNQPRCFLAPGLVSEVVLQLLPLQLMRARRKLQPGEQTGVKMPQVRYRFLLG